jgi:hypothetical protein
MMGDRPSAFQGITMDDSQLIRLLHSLAEMPHEMEWLEFKVNQANPQPPELFPIPSMRS